MRNRFEHVIIDEYQDLTAAEQHLVEKIWSRNGSLVVLGDDDQSIYSFRNNHPGGITECVERWEGEPLADLEIPENRRCGRVIVDLANAMMAQAGSTNAPMISKRRNGVTSSGIASITWILSVLPRLVGRAPHER